MRATSYAEDGRRCPRGHAAGAHALEQRVQIKNRPSVRKSNDNSRLS